jgi:hypothetical protein
MKAVIKKVMVIVLVFVFSTSILAQEPKTEQFINKAKQNYLRSMDSDYNSVIESAIVITMEMRDRYPEFNYSKLIDRFNELAIDGKTPVLRYKAQLASLYFNFYPMFSDIKIGDKDYPELFFKQISERLEQRPVAVN